MNELYPFTGRFLSLGNVRMHYLDEGPRDGEPMVMVHGNPTWSFYYRNLTLKLRDRYRVIVPDHVGCGLSDKPDDTEYAYALARRVDDLTRLIDACHLERPITLVVHDWGGMIGMAWAVRHWQRIGRLVILNTAAFPIPPGKRLPWSIWMCRLPLIGPLLVRGANAFCRGATRYCVTRKPLSAAIRAQYLAPYGSWHDRRAVLRFVQDIPLGPTDPSHAILTETERNLEKLRSVPKLICWGGMDFVFDDHFLKEWQRRFPDAEVHRIADAGHYVLEDAGDEIAAHVERFLAQTAVK